MKDKEFKNTIPDPKPPVKLKGISESGDFEYHTKEEWQQALQSHERECTRRQIYRDIIPADNQKRIADLVSGLDESVKRFVAGSLSTEAIDPGDAERILEALHDVIMRTGNQFGLDAKGKGGKIGRVDFVVKQLNELRVEMG